MATRNKLNLEELASKIGVLNECITSEHEELFWGILDKARTIESTLHIEDYILKYMTLAEAEALYNQLSELKYTCNLKDITY